MCVIILGPIVFFGVPKPGCFKPGNQCLQFLRGKALLPLFCALLCPFALFCRLAFALVSTTFCGHLRSFAVICVFLRPTAFRTTVFGNCRYLEGEELGP